MIYSFGDCELDTQRGEVHRDGKLIKLEPLVFYALMYLVQHRDRIVPKRELLEQLWPQQFVSDWVLTRCIKEIRRAIGCSGRAQSFIKTLYGIGYRFVAAVAERPPMLHIGATSVVPDPPHTHTLSSTEEGDPPPRLSPPLQDQNDLQLDEEHQQVTVLCGFLANATALAETLGPEATQSRRREFFTMVLHLIQRYEGTIQQLAEEHFIALFGIPRTHEDHARRALMAAMELYRCLDQPGIDHVPGVETAPQSFWQFQVRLGLYTGPVMVWRGRRKPEAVYTAMGETTSLATQFAQRAAPNTILISEATAQRVRDEAVLAGEGCVYLSEATTPISAYKVLEMRAQHDPVARPGAHALSQFVGREQELALLHRLLGQVENGRGQVVGIVGEPGMGKSRLVYEFRRSLEGRSVLYLEGHCRSYGSAIPSLPILDLIRHYCGITVADRPETVVAKVHRGLAESGIDPEEGMPYVLHFLGVPADTERLAGRSPEASKARTVAFLQHMLLHGSQRQPLVLVVENLHWIDRISEDVCATLVEHLPGVPLFLLVTYRPGYQPPWVTKSYAAQITLQPLSPQESLTVVHARSEAAWLAEPVLQDIVTRAEGNPLFLEELTRAVVERSAAQGSMPVPDTIEDVLRARIDQLPEASRRLLQVAAVVGRRGALRLLQMVWQEPETLETALRELQRSEFLYMRHGETEPGYVFKHALTQEVAYASLAPARRQAVHAATGQALETVYAHRLDEVYDRLAYHYARTHDASKAVEYLTRFAEQATRRYTYSEAVWALQQALQHAEHLPAPQRERRSLEVVLHLAQVWAFLGRFAESLTLLRQQPQRLKRLQDAALASAYYLRLGRTYSLLGDQGQAVRYTRRSLAAATRAGDSVAMGKAYYDLAREIFLSGPLRQGLAYGQRAIALLEHATGEEWWLGLTYWIVGSLHGLLGEFAPALEATARAQAIGAAIDDLHVQSYAASATGWIEAMRGDGTAGVAASRQSLEWALDPVNVTLAKGILGYAYLEQGEATQAIPLLEQAAQQWGYFGLRAMQGWMTTYLAEAYRVTGSLVAAQDLARQGLTIASNARCLFAVGCAQRALGRITQARGTLVTAATHLTEALQTFTALEARFEVGRTHLDLATVTQAQGHPQTAVTHLAQAQTLFQALQVPRYVEQTVQSARSYGVLLHAGRGRQRHA
jgi:class 3 adenylate cyclase/tetratricopeptide (TPR) repeat protein